MSTPGRPLKVEQNIDDSGVYSTEWYCEEPPPEVPYFVVREEWAVVEGIRVHRIFEVRPV